MTEAERASNMAMLSRFTTSGFTPMFYALGEDKQRSVMKLITAGE